MFCIRSHLEGFVSFFCLVFFLFYYYSTSTFIFLSIQLKSFATYWCCHPYFFSISFLFWQEIIKDVLQEIIKPDSAEKKDEAEKAEGEKTEVEEKGEGDSKETEGEKTEEEKKKVFLRLFFFILVWFPRLSTYLSLFIIFADVLKQIIKNNH